MSELQMEAIKAMIFLNVQDRLETLKELRLIDEDLGQLEIDDLKERELPLAFPCALIDFVDEKFTDNSKKSQEAETVLQVRIGLLAYAGAAHYYKDDKKKNALQRFNLEHRVNAILHGWSNDRYFNPLTRFRAYTEKRPDNVKVRVIQYRFGYKDNTAVTLPTTSHPLPELVIMKYSQHEVY